MNIIENYVLFDRNIWIKCTMRGGLLHIKLDYGEFGNLLFRNVHFLKKKNKAFFYITLEIS